MSNNRKPFFAITPDIDDVALEEIARAKGVPSLTRAEQPASEPVPAHTTEPPKSDPVGQGREVLPESVLREPADAVELPPHAAVHGPTPRERISYVKAGIPDYALLELKTRAAQQKVSLNHIILSALKAAGITIREADLVEDGRRLRGRNTV